MFRKFLPNNKLLEEMAHQSVLKNVIGIKTGGFLCVFFFLPKTQAVSRINIA